MIKSLLNLNFSPILFNIFIIIIISFPSKNNKFNPITLTFILILLTLLISIKIYLIINSWRPYILFLIIIGGLIIIFIYITSLTNNELFSIHFKYILLNIIKILPLIFIFLYLWLINFLPNEANNSNIWFNNIFINYYLNFYELNSSNIYENSLFIINYLFFSIICIINICYKLKSPLRQLFF